MFSSGVGLPLDLWRPVVDRLPDVPEPLAPLLQLQMSARPRSMREWGQWLAAVSQEGYERPGSFSVLSIIILIVGFIAQREQDGLKDEAPQFYIIPVDGGTTAW